MVSRDLFERIDACRPGEVFSPDGDAARGETAAEAERLRERIVSWDRKIGGALAKGEAPAGLAGRLVATLAASAAMQSAVEQKGATVESGNKIEPVPARVASRRTMLRFGTLIAAGGAVAATVLFLLGWFDPQQPPITAERLVEDAIAFYPRDERGVGAKSMESAPRELPPSDDVVPPAAWRDLSQSFSDSRTVAYDLNVNGIQATLYATVTPVQGLDNAPPPQPAQQTQGRSAAAWQVDRVVYVLVVEGGTDEYRRLLRQPGGVLAFRRSSLAYAAG